MWGFGSTRRVFKGFIGLLEGGGDFFHFVFDFADGGVDFLDEVVFGLGEAFDAVGLFGDGLEEGVLAAGELEHPVEAENPAGEVDEADEKTEEDVQEAYSLRSMRNMPCHAL